MDVEGKGRVFTRKAKAHSITRRSDCVAGALDLEVPLLQSWQHKIATRSAAAAPKEAPPRFLSLTIRMRLAKLAARCIRMSFTRASAWLPSVRPSSSRGRHWSGGPGARTRHNRNF